MLGALTYSTIIKFLVQTVGRRSKISERPPVLPFQCYNILQSVLLFLSSSVLNCVIFIAKSYGDRAKVTGAGKSVAGSS